MKLLGYPHIKNIRNELKFLNGRYCFLPNEYLQDKNKEKLVDFYREVRVNSKSTEIITGIDPIGFTFLSLGFICYVGLVTNFANKKLYKKRRLQYPKNHFDLGYLKKQIQFEYDLLNFKEFLPIDIITQNIHELRGLNAKISGNIDIIMNIQSEDEWDDQFESQDESVKKIYVGSRLIKFILDNFNFYMPNYFENLRFNKNSVFVAHRSVSKIVKIYRNDFKKDRADIEFTGTSFSRIRGKKEYFEILIKILIENALKYSEYPKTFGPKVKIYEVKGYIDIQVHSYGRTIPKMDRPYLFVKGFRSAINKDLKEGTGMGLYNAKQLAKHFRGTLSFSYEDITVNEDINLAWNIFTLSIKIANI